MRTGWFKLWLGLVLSVAVGLACLGTVLRLPSGGGILAPPPLPDPNGYDDLVRAGRLITKAPEDVGAATVDELRAFVESNADALEHARLALGRECGVPVKYSMDYLDGVSEPGQSLRALSRLFQAEGKVAAADGHTADAIRSYLDAVRLGDQSMRGGLVLDRLLGGAIGSVGREGLRELRASLSEEECRQIIRALESINSGREPLEEALAREHDFTEAVIRDMGLSGILVARTIRQQKQQGVELAERSANRHEAKLRLLMIDLAIRGYKSQTGSYPQNLAELFPSFLAAVPLDPFGGRPIVYRLEPIGYLLYSIGPDLQDDGGAPMISSSGSPIDKGDLFLDPEPSPPDRDLQ